MTGEQFAILTEHGFFPSGKLTADDWVGFAQNMTDTIIELRSQLKDAQFERNLAIAHDQQPYPTAEAYELACKIRDRYRADLTASETSRTNLRMAIAAKRALDRGAFADNSHAMELLMEWTRALYADATIPNRVIDMLKKVESELVEISGHQWTVISKSTGVEQRGPTEPAIEAKRVQMFLREAMIGLGYES